MSDMTQFAMAIISSGVLASLVSVLTTRVLKKGEQRDNLSDKHRDKKDEAVEELSKSFEKLFNPETSTTKSDIVPIPRHKCPARKYDGQYFIPMSYEFLEDVGKLVEYRNEICAIISKNQFWFSDELNSELNRYVSYLYTLQQITLLGIIELNKTLSVLLSIDIYNMHMEINRQIRSCYFGKPQIRYKAINIPRYWKKHNKANSNTALANLTMMMATKKQRKEFSHIKPEKSNFYKHYKECMSCDNRLPLSQTRFFL